MKQAAKLTLVVVLVWPVLAMAQSWQSVNNPHNVNANGAFLLTDGTVLIHDQGPTSGGSPNWWKLTPDQNGSYVNGTWSQVASMPSGYAPLYFASAVLADGRFVVMGGEYNNITPSNPELESNLGAIYDPTSNTWTPLPSPPPDPYPYIGDEPSAILRDGKFLLGQSYSSQLAELDPATLTWTVVPSLNPGSYVGFNESDWTLLPDGTILDLGEPLIQQRYLPSTGQWIPTAALPPSLDPGFIDNCAMLRPDGTVFALLSGGLTGIYTPPGTITDGGTWAAGPSFPVIPGEGQLTSGENTCVLLPSGNVLVVGAGATGINHYFEFDGANLNEVPSTAVTGMELLLPTGQVLSATYSPAIYTPSGSPNPSWAPTITSAPSAIGPGATYTISGTQFNGLSEAVTEGDDYSAATNYPLVRITNDATGHVFYARTHDHSVMAVATGSANVSTDFDVPVNIDLGASHLVVVANGIASAPEPVTVMNLTASSIALASSQNPAAGGQPVTFTATATGTSGTPTGKVTFMDGAVRIGTGALNANGVATFTTPTLFAGSHSLTAVYSGDSTFSSSSSAAVDEEVNGTNSATVLTSSLNSSSLGQMVTLTATVAGAGGVTPNGTVIFMDGTSWIGSIQTNSAGTASLLTAILQVGSHQITARYEGDPNFSGSTSNVLTQVVSKSTPTVTVTPSPSSVSDSQPISVTVSVQGQYFNPGPTGLVTVSSGSYTSAATTLVPGEYELSSATIMVPPSSLPTGANTLTASYEGDGSYKAASGIGSVTVTSSTSGFTVSPTSLGFPSQEVGSTSGAESITLTNSGQAPLTITSIVASGDFSENNTCGASVPGTSNCIISVTFTPTAGGARTGMLTITDNAPDSPQTVALSGTGSSVTITPPSGNSGLSIDSAGGTATTTLQIGSTGGFSGAVNLTCSVAFTGSGTANDPPTCSLNPTQEQVSSGGSANVTLTVNTTAASSAMLLDPLGGGATLAAFAILFLVPRRRRRGVMMLLVLGLATAMTITACGGGGAGNSGNSGGLGGSNQSAGTTSGSYTVTVMAASGTDAASVSIPLSVQ